MKSTVDCVHCYLKQAVTGMNLAGVNKNEQYQILYRLMDEIKLLDTNETPAENSTMILLKMYQIINSVDPYGQIKKESNDLALKIYPQLKEHLTRSKNRLYDALKMAVAGNVIDLGIKRDFDIDASLNYSLQVGFSKDHFKEFTEKMNQVNDLVLIGDNSGEIVFDKILVEELARLGKKVTYIVKGGPILNDATMDDALYVGMDKVANVITTGSNYLGAPLKHISSQCRSYLEQANLIIAKGQANFESLEHEQLTKEKIFFLLKIKCEAISQVAGAKFGEVVFFCKKDK